MHPSLTLHTFENDSISYVAPTWEELHALAFEMAQQIRASDHSFDRVVTLAKGGWPMSRSLADFLEVSEVQSLGLSFYKGVNERKAKPTVYQDLPVNIMGEHILLFDDVADTGESLLFATEYLKERGAASVTTATVFYKERSQIVPDFFSAQVAEWIIFPYELVESLKDIGTRWLTDSISPDEVISRFITLQFPENQVRYFVETALLVE
ncbi:MAG: phosphoribosyltransferase [Candidatus Pacebacteria bacterium]|nr:phosphoribosyltransferase [Candidatus Paceibacterota bacterium]PIR63969.1 MAG: hypothetical protein COU64_01550 [Candidatus Pacebacteria bacterium CG10_big_fil_rev_8_21_14_0_10_40_26]PIZ79103.1 MAG: hypothetical protein COY01_01605 [Candidatus Pacebacteria bacterium CG_4_10_14_0_2_um_filter_40_20]PJA69209.1 MAG: hypothetical protein CO156_01230 [Candidatus Pacebacteria bacterium CG_4_9_14_3_um_filter_40_12]PJC42069.1 MAG: hypothetical protein CO041_00315 [Candidatus Pacebacteria bacterium CG